jgi:hypothetical protein
MASVTCRLPTLDRILPAQQKKAVLQHLALLAIGRMKRRTAQGRDVNGAAFQPYSKRYAKQREQAGRTTDVALTLSGAMLGSMQILSVTEKQALIGFAGSAPRTKFGRRTRTVKDWKGQHIGYVNIQVNAPRKGRGGRRITHSVTEGTGQVSNALKAYWNDHGAGKVPRRHFFGLSDEDRRFLTKTALRLILDIAGRVSLNRALNR